VIRPVKLHWSLYCVCLYVPYMKWSTKAAGCLNTVTQVYHPLKIQLKLSLFVISAFVLVTSFAFFFLICIVGVESKLGPLGTSATYWSTAPAPGDCEDGEFGGMNGRGNRSTRRKPAPAPLCPPQFPLDQTRVWTRAAAVGSQRLTALAMARPMITKNELERIRNADDNEKRSGKDSKRRW
jgi:hypothetical protein